MLKKRSPEHQIPIIVVDESTCKGAELFDVNYWTCIKSRGLITSSWSEYSVLCYCFECLASMCKTPELYLYAEKHIKSVQYQWKRKKFDLKKCVFYGEYPDLHIQIEAFFSGMKSLLDLLVQLLSTEKIINGEVHGFHEKGTRILKTLENNIPSKNKDIAAKFHTLISKNKKDWIEQMILARDQLIHPEQGMGQLRLHLEFSEKGNELECIKINPPSIKSEPIHQYAKRTLKDIENFAIDFINLLKNK